MTLRRLLRSLVSGAIIVVALSSGGVARSWAAEEDVMRPRFYMDQASDAMPLKTMRGIWRYKEKREGQVSFDVLTCRRAIACVCSYSHLTSKRKLTCLSPRRRCATPA